MKEYEELEREFYIANNPTINDAYRDIRTLWNKISRDNGLLKWAIQPCKTKWGEDIVNGLTIAHYILSNYKTVDNDIYNKLVEEVFSSQKLASCTERHGFTFLEEVLWNTDLKLTEEQKNYVLYMVSQDGPISGNRGGFGIYYWILRNSNWSIEEKLEFLYKFYPDDEDYDETLGIWHDDVLEEAQNCLKEYCYELDEMDLCDCTYEDLLSFLNNKEAADKVLELLEFFKLMITLRPPMWRLTEFYKISPENTKRISSLRQYMAATKGKFYDYQDILNTLTSEFGYDKEKQSLDEFLNNSFESFINQGAANLLLENDDLSLDISEVTRVR